MRQYVSGQGMAFIALDGAGNLASEHMALVRPDTDIPSALGSIECTRRGGVAGRAVTRRAVCFCRKPVSELRTLASGVRDEEHRAPNGECDVSNSRDSQTGPH